MTKPITHVLLIVDMSGSMWKLVPDVRGGVNTLLAEYQKSDSKFRVTMTLFNHVVTPLCVAAKPKDAPRLTETNYYARGNTALLDAVGKTVSEFEATTTLGDEDRVLCVLQTDGEENWSSEWTYEKVSELIKEREKTDQWAFLYMGAGPDAWHKGSRYGFGQSVNTVGTRSGTRTAYSGVAVASTLRSQGASAADTVAAAAAEVEANREADEKDGAA